MSLLLADPDATRIALDMADSADSLYDFMTLGWPVLEPAQPMVHGWCLERVCEHLEAVTAGEIRRLVINIPPGTSKSRSTCVYWPMWEWGPKGLPHHRWVMLGHKIELPRRDNLSARNLALSPWYQERWGHVWQMTGDQAAKDYYMNDQTGYRVVGSSNSVPIGFRGDRFVIDDPHTNQALESEKRRDEVLRVFSEDIGTRVNTKASAIIVIMQRQGVLDVSGHILKSELGYEHLCLPMEYERAMRSFTTVPRPGIEPRLVRRMFRATDTVPRWWEEDELAEELAANPLGEQDRLSEPRLLTPQDDRTEEGELLWPERFDAEQVEELKQQFRSRGGTFAEAGQLQQRPVARGGGRFKRDNFQIIDASEVPRGLRWVRGWDLAGTASKRAAWTAGVKMAIAPAPDERVFIGDVRRFRADPGPTENGIKSTAEHDGKRLEIDLPQDPGQAGKAQMMHYRKKLQGWTVYSSPESGSKDERAMPLASQVDGYNVYLVRGPWNDAFLGEAESFPGGEFRDQIDAASRAYARCLTPRGQQTPVGPSVYTQEI